MFHSRYFRPIKKLSANSVEAVTYPYYALFLCFSTLLWEIKFEKLKIPANLFTLFWWENRVEKHLSSEKQKRPLYRRRAGCSARPPICQNLSTDPSRYCYYSERLCHSWFFCPFIIPLLRGPPSTVTRWLIYFDNVLYNVLPFKVAKRFSYRKLKAK